MASSSKSGRKRVRSTVEVHFTSGSEKDAFQRRLEHIRQRLMPTGSSTALDNRSLLEAMFDIVEGAVPPTSSFPPGERASSTQSFQRNSGEYIIMYATTSTKVLGNFIACIGVYTGDATTQDQDTFLVERHCLTDLLDGLKSVCCCGMASNPWRLHSFVQVRDIINIILLVIQILIYNSVFRKATLLDLCSSVVAAKFSVGRGLAPDFLEDTTC